MARLVMLTLTLLIVGCGKPKAVTKTKVCKGTWERQVCVITTNPPEVPEITPTHPCDRYMRMGNRLWNDCMDGMANQHPRQW